MTETETQTVQDIVYALAASPNFAQNGVCFAARDTGLYRSTDGGQNWQLAYAGLNLTEPLITMAVVVSPNFSNDQTVFAGVPGGILHSTDGGQTWHVNQLPHPPPVVISLAVSPNYAQDGTVWAGTLEDGVYLSTSRGQRWAVWNFGLLDPHVLGVFISPNFEQDQTVFAGTETGIFCSRNKGRSWQETGFPPEAAPVLSMAISPDFGQDGMLFAGTESQGLYYSEDQGNSWVKLDTGVAAVNGIVLAPTFPARPEILLLSDDNLSISRDKGQSWAQAVAATGVVSFAAPQDLSLNASLLLGFYEAGVVRKDKLLA